MLPNYLHKYTLGEPEGIADYFKITQRNRILTHNIRIPSTCGTIWYHIWSIYHITHLTVIGVGGAMTGLLASETGKGHALLLTYLDGS